MVEPREHPTRQGKRKWMLHGVGAMNGWGGGMRGHEAVGEGVSAMVSWRWDQKRRMAARETREAKESWVVEKAGQPGDWRWAERQGRPCAEMAESVRGVGLGVGGRQH